MTKEYRTCPSCYKVIPIEIPLPPELRGELVYCPLCGESLAIFRFSCGHGYFTTLGEYDTYLSQGIADGDYPCLDCGISDPDNSPLKFQCYVCGAWEFVEGDEAVAVREGIKMGIEQPCWDCLPGELGKSLTRIGALMAGKN